nr:hypothetical transcript [Hymenolepis microstoma]
MDLPNGGNALVIKNSKNNNNQKLLPPSPPPPPPILTPTLTHHHQSKRCIRLKSKALIIVSAFLLTVILLQIVIIGLIVNYHYVQSANSGSSLIVRAKAGKAPSELEVRGQILQLADLLSWGAKCNRVLYDLVVSCYGAPGKCNDYTELNQFELPSFIAISDRARRVLHALFPSLNMGWYIQNMPLCNSKNVKSTALKSKAGKAPSELEVRGQILQLADLLSWGAKCNRVLYDLVVSCYGAPGKCNDYTELNYLASGGKVPTKARGFQYNKSFPRNWKIPTRHGHKNRKTRPPKPFYADDKTNETQREHMKEVINPDPQTTPNSTVIET